jgi:hypothetical protein
VPLHAATSAALQELRQRSWPIGLLGPSQPLGLYVMDHSYNSWAIALAVGEMAAILDDLPELTVERLADIAAADHLADHRANCIGIGPVLRL